MTTLEDAARQADAATEDCVWILLDSHGPRPFDEQRAAGGPYIVVVENPADGLAAVLARRGADPVRWLSAWRVGGRRALQSAQRDRGRCILISADDARQQPREFAELCAAHLGTAPAVWEPARDQVAAARALVEPLGRALGAALAFADGDAQALFAELQASCAPLDKNDAAALPSDGLQIDAAAAAQALRQLLADREAAISAADESVTLRAQVESLALALRLQAESAQFDLEQANSRLASALAESESARRRVSALQAQVEAANREAAEQSARATDQAERESQQREAQLEELRSRLATTQALLAEAREVTQRSARASDQAERESQQREAQLEELRSRLATTQALLADAREGVSEGDRAHAAELAAARRELGVARQERELLLEQLRQVQEELEQLFLKCRKLETAGAAGPMIGVLDMSIAELRATHERDTPPHRELTLHLRQVKAGMREVPHANVRLVEHLGHPGLVVFANPGNAQLFECWRDSGHENDERFMLLMPSDVHSRPTLESMGSADWILVQALAMRIESHLRRPQASGAPHWYHLARRLREQLREMPSRFRYDRLEVEAVHASDPKALALRFDRVDCGARQLERLTVHWRPFGPRSGLDLLLDAQAGPPLPSWPDDPRGVCPDRVTLPLGRASTKAETRAAWLQLTPEDRAFVLALFAALPGAASRIPTTLADAFGAPLSSAASNLISEARRCLAPPRGPGALVRRAVRSLRRPLSIAA
jgi:predicted  nucleic acid-binding Zn-ribbon protein